MNGVVAACRAVIASVVSQIRSIAIVGGAALAAMAVISVFTEHPLAMFFRLLSYCGIALMLLSAAAMILTFKKARDVAPAMMLGSLAVALLSTLVSLAFIRILPAKGWMVVALLLGGALGVLWARTARLFVDGQRIRMCGTAWYLAVWALTLALNQGFTAMTGHSAWAMSLLPLAGAGLAIGNTLAILWRAHRASVVLHLAGRAGHD